MTVNITARMAPRELAIAAYHAQMTDASQSEVGRYSILRLAGYSHDEAKKMATANRSTIYYSDDPKNIAIRVDEEWLEKVKANHPNLSISMLFRYAVARITSPHDEAMEIAYLKMGRPKSQKGK